MKQTADLDVTPNGEEGEFWQSGAGPAADPQGNVYLMSANGAFDESLNAEGFPLRHNFGNSFLKISLHDGKLSIADYFTMFDVAQENAAHGDLGSGGPLVLPDMKDAAGRAWRLVVGAGKDLNIYLLNRDAMGKFSKQGNQGVYQELTHAIKHQFSRPIPAYFHGRLYYASTEDPLREFRFENARLIAKPASETDLKFVYPGASPSVSANGVLEGIVWVTENLDQAVLHAYDAEDLRHEVYSSSAAAAEEIPLAQATSSSLR